MDWPIHFALTSSFTHGDNFPAQNPLYSGQLISYPFFADFLSSILQVFNLSLQTSFALPGVLLGFVIFALLYSLGIILTNSQTKSILGLLIAIFWGGIGFIYYFKDLINSSNWWEFINYPPVEYTFYEQKNLWFFSFLYSELLPQRAMLLGIPLFLSSLILFINGLSTNNRNSFFISGILLGVMPFFHMHSFISLAMLLMVFIPFYLLKSNTADFENFKKSLFNLTVFSLPVLILFLLQIPLLLSVNLSQTIGFHLGWMSGQENLIIFWLKNTFLFIPLITLALFMFNRLLSNDNLTKAVFASSIILFIAPNIFRFAPWPYDNLKIFTYWYFINSFLVSSLLVYLYRKNLILKIIVPLVVMSLTLSGFIEVTRSLNSSKGQLRIFSAEDISLANLVKEKTIPNSTILAAAVHDHPASALAGRKLIIGFPGNAWSWGLSDWFQREQDVRAMLRAEPQTKVLLNKYDISYVLIGNREKYFEPLLNEQYFLQNFNLIAQMDDYKIYQVK